MSEPEQKDEGKDAGAHQLHGETLRGLLANLGPPVPDDPGVCYDPDTAGGQAMLQAYFAKRAELYRQADEEWARQHPGVEFRRLMDRLRRFLPPQVDLEGLDQEP